MTNYVELLDLCTDRALYPRYLMWRAQEIRKRLEELDESLYWLDCRGVPYDRAVLFAHFWADVWRGNAFRGSLTEREWLLGDRLNRLDAENVKAVCVKWKEAMPF